MFKTIENRVPISKVVANQIEEAIFAKKYLPGSKLPSELELCQMFGVSRTAIREALQSLAAQNLISIAKGKGIFVSELTSDTFVEPMKKFIRHNLDPDYIREMVHARQVLEPSLAASAAVRRNDDDIKILSEDLEALRTYEGEFDELARIDMKFHNDIAIASHNQILQAILEPMIYTFSPSIEVKSYVYETVGNAKESAYEKHKEILRYIVDQNADEAYKAMTEHLVLASEHTEIMLAIKYKQEEV